MPFRRIRIALAVLLIAAGGLAASALAAGNGIKITFPTITVGKTFHYKISGNSARNYPRDPRGFRTAEVTLDVLSHPCPKKVTYEHTADQNVPVHKGHFVLQGYSTHPGLIEPNTTQYYCAYLFYYPPCPSSCKPFGYHPAKVLARKQYKLVAGHSGIVKVS